MATCTLFVGNLDYQMTDDELYKVFESFATIAFDHDRRRSRGFGYVTFERDSDAKTAIDQLNNSEIHGRPIKVEVSRPKQPRKDRPYDHPRMTQRDYKRFDNYRGGPPRDDYRRDYRGNDHDGDRPRYSGRQRRDHDEWRDYR